MNKWTIVCSLLALNGTLLSQINFKLCNCETVFSDLIQKVEKNYIVLAQLRLDGTANEYEQHVSEFRNKSKAISSGDCAQFLQSFLSFFKDGHLFAFEAPKYSESEKAAIRSHIKKNIRQASYLDSMLQEQINVKQSDKSNKVIGIWKDTRSRIAIIKEGIFFNAYIRASTSDGIEAGELKAQFQINGNEIEGRYYSYDYGSTFKFGGIYKDGTLINLSGGIYWSKESTAESRISEENTTSAALPSIVPLGKMSTLFSIPSFSYSNKQAIKMLLKKHKKTLENSTYLIFDIRGNGGGSGSLYFDIIALFAERDMESSQGKVLASPANQLYFEKLAKSASRLYRPVVQRIKENPGKIVDGPAYTGIKYSPAKNMIQQVAILTDGGCMSAAESFILHAKQASDKVLTFGSPTKGVIDNTSVHVLGIDSGRQNILFGYPTSTWHQAVLPKDGYNKNGIVPDIPLAPYMEDKIGAVMEYLRENPKGKRK